MVVLGDGPACLAVDYFTYSAPDDMRISAGTFFIDDSSSAIAYGGGANNHIPHNEFGNEEFLLTSHYLPARATASLNFTGKTRCHFSDQALKLYFDVGTSIKAFGSLADASTSGNAGIAVIDGGPPIQIVIPPLSSADFEQGVYPNL